MKRLEAPLTGADAVAGTAIEQRKKEPVESCLAYGPVHPPTGPALVYLHRAQSLGVLSLTQ